MSQNRYLAGRYPYNEKGRCHWCGEPVRPPRRTWCSEACVDEYLLRTSPGGIRAAVQKRDHGICAECGLPCDRCCPVVGQYTGGWAADHIVPVWRGGGECGLDNLQTLCVPCHRQKTAREAAERAALNRPEPLPSLQLEMAL